jgi:hypothetical protein
MPVVLFFCNEGDVICALLRLFARRVGYGASPVMRS